MDNRLIKKYLEYAGTEEAYAVLFVKTHLTQAKGHWVDIVGCERYERSSNNLHFRYVAGSLYKRKIKPQYPLKSAYTLNGKFDEHEYYLAIRAITWKTAHIDIEQQKLKGVVPRKFKITGVSYDKNRNKKTFFREDAPPEIKSLEHDLCDRTNSLWDIALYYANRPEFVYKIKKVYIE